MPHATPAGAAAAAAGAPVQGRFNQLLAELGEELRVFYLYGADRLPHGWGEVAVAPGCIFLDRPGGRAALSKALLSPNLRAVSVFGYRGVARLAAANVARLRRLPLVLRGDANVRDEWSRPALRRLLKRWYLRAALGQLPRDWPLSTALTRAITNIRRIPLPAPQFG